MNINWRTLWHTLPTGALVNEIYFIKHLANFSLYTTANMFDKSFKSVIPKRLFDWTSCHFKKDAWGWWLTHSRWNERALREMLLWKCPLDLELLWEHLLWHLNHQLQDAAKCAMKRTREDLTPHTPSVLLVTRFFRAAKRAGQGEYVGTWYIQCIPRTA